MADTSTRARLLAAAREEFAAHGISGARVDRIAQSAGVNKERIYGYFGSKEKLFEAVVVEVKDELTAVIGLPSGDLAEWVGRLYDYHRDSPTHLRLTLWEALYYSDGRPERTAAYDDKIESLAEALGHPADRNAPAMLLILIGLAAWPHAVPQLRRFITGTEADGSADDPVRRQVVAFTRQALGTPKDP